MPNIDLAERIKIIGARIREGRDTYAGRQDAWHTLGDVIGKFATRKEILDAAKLSFPVVKLQLEFQGAPVDVWGTFRVDAEVPKGLENRSIRKVKLDNGQEYYLNFLGPVGKDYTVIQHTEGFDLIDHLVGQIDGAHYETAGQLEFGRLVWTQANLNFKIRVGEDESDIYLTFNTSHDGSKAFQIYETGTRIVCRNTFRIASLKRLEATLRVRHTKNASQRTSDLKAEIDEIKNVALSMQEKLVWLSQRRVTKESLETIMKRLFPMAKDDNEVETSSTRRDNILAEILSLYESNDGDAFPEQRGTAYALLNSVTNYTDHLRSSKADGRAQSAVFGSGDKLKTSALDLILAEAEKMPAMLRGGQGIAVDYAEAGLNLPSMKAN